MRLTHILPILLAALFCLPGCGPKTPDGIPKLFSTTVTVTNGSNPVKSANVFLVPEEGTASGSWSVVGLTDERGVAVIETTQGDWKASGAPEGSYVVYLTKVPTIEEPEMPADIETNEEAKSKYFEERQKRLEAANKEIPKSLTSNDTSDLKITVAAGSGAKETFEIGSYTE